MNNELTSREVAELLGVSERAVLYAVERGDLAATPEYKGKRRFWRFTRSDVQTYLEQLQHQRTEGNA